MGKFGLSYDLVKLSFTVINREKYLLFFSLFSTISFLFFTYSYIFDVMGLKSFDLLNYARGFDFGVGVVVMTFLYYFSFLFISLFLEAVIIIIVYRSLTGKKTGFFIGLKLAFGSLGAILKWTFVSSIVSTIIKFLEENFPSISKYIVLVFGGLWKIATFFTFPNMVLHRAGLVTSMKRSVVILKKNWGEAIITNLAISFIFVIFTVILFLFCGSLGYYFYLLGNMFMVYLFAIVLAIGFILLHLFSATSFIVIKTLLYIYAETGKLPDFVDVKLLEKVFE